MPVISAEIQRVILLIGLAATAYLMILAWNQDYGPKAPAPHASAPEVQTLPADVPSVATEAAGSDVPDESLLAPEQPAATGPATPVAQTPVVGTSAADQAVLASRLVKVNTHDLQLWIDRLGGDIVRVQLPEFPVSLEEPDVPFVLLDTGNGSVYVAQSGLIGPNGTDSGAERPLFDAASNEFDFRGSGGSVVLTTHVGDVEVRKTFTFEPTGYHLLVDYTIDNGSTAPFEVGLFAQLKRDDQAPQSSRVPLGPRPYVGAALTTPDERYVKLKFGKLDEEDYRTTVTGGWIAMLQHYFLSAWIGDPEQANHYYGQHRPDGTYIVGFTSPLTTIEPGSTGRFSTEFYAGPKDQKVLETLAPNLNLTVDYGFLWWIAVPLFHLLDWLHGFLGNWGVSIILLTLVVKVALYPLSAASFKSMAKMRKVAPQMKRLQERYADDRQKLSQEMMALYQKEGANPLGGCLPMLVQMPVFISLYWVLFESVELRQSPFFLWIRDLSVMDPLFVLPILMGASMYFQQLLNPPMPDPMQARIMRMMPIMFTVLFLFFPAGLVLYWLVNNLLSMTQQWLITRQIEAGGTQS